MAAGAVLHMECDEHREQGRTRGVDGFHHLDQAAVADGAGRQGQGGDGEPAEKKGRIRYEAMDRPPRQRLDHEQRVQQAVDQMDELHFPGAQPRRERRRRMRLPPAEAEHGQGQQAQSERFVPAKQPGPQGIGPGQIAHGPAENKQGRHEPHGRPVDGFQNRCVALDGFASGHGMRGGVLWNP